MAEINSYILNYDIKSYANAGGHTCRLDCSLGVNDDNIPARVLQCLTEISADTVKHYPHTEEVIQKLIEKFDGITKLAHENFSLGCGSIDLLYQINCLYLNPSKTVVGYAPQFSAYVDHVHFMGANYLPYVLKQEDGYAFHADEFISFMENNPAHLIYVDNPNNPTGQVIPLSEIEKIVAAAHHLNAAVIVDEAYGDYMPLENSAVSLFHQYEHLYVTKSFSKGYGLAGMRMGYAMGNKQSIAQLNKLVTPFNCNGLARKLAISMLDGEDYLKTLLERTTQKKEQLLSGLTKIKAAKTAPYTPISLLYTEDPSVDLCHLLNQVGISTVSGASFDHLGIHAVRLMLCEDMSLLLELLKQAEKQLP